MQLYFVITSNCNYKCGFCIRHNAYRQTDSVVSASDFKFAANELAKLWPDATFVLTGGEPTLHPNFIEFLDYATSLFRNVTVTSNGSFKADISEQLIPFLKRNIVIQLSLDGTKNTHDRLRGGNAYDKATENLRRLHQVWEKVVVSTTVGRANISDVPLFATELNKFKFHHLKVSLEQAEDPLRDTVSIDEWNTLVDRLLPLARYRVHIRKMFDFRLWDRALAQGLPEHITRNCGYGTQKLYILPNLDVLPCSCSSATIGNLKTDGGSDIAANLQKIGDIVPDSLSPCHTCKYAKLCNGGCPGYSIKVFGKSNMGDIRCPIIKKFYDEKSEGACNGQV